MAITKLPEAIDRNTGKAMYRSEGVSSRTRYLEVFVPGHPSAKKRAGWVPLHRIVAENTIGRYLFKGEQVRFINKNPFDYSPKNLKIVDTYTF